MGGRTDGVVGHEQEVHQSVGFRDIHSLVVRRIVVVHEASDRAGSVDERQGRRNELIPLSSDEAMLKTWQDKYGYEGKEMVAAYENDPQKSEYPKLSPGDGR